MLFGKVQQGKITIFYGKMGSGKTTNAMAQVLDFHRRGLPVWVNFPVIGTPTVRSVAAPISREDDPAGILHMRGGLYVIDEAYLTLNSREWASLPKEVFTAFTHVRKLDMTVVIIAQSWMRIDKSIREVSSIAREFRGSSFFGRAYRYAEYEIDEMGEIIKGEPVEYRAAMPGFSVIGRKVYDAFDTDYLFAKKAPGTKTWPSAIIENGAAGGGATVQPAPLRNAPQEPGSSASEGGKERLGRGLAALIPSVAARSLPSSPPSPDTAASAPTPLRVAEHSAPRGTTLDRKSQTP